MAIAFLSILEDSIALLRLFGLVVHLPMNNTTSTWFVTQVCPPPPHTHALTHAHNKDVCTTHRRHVHNTQKTCAQQTEGMCTTHRRCVHNTQKAWLISDSVMTGEGVKDAWPNMAVRHAVHTLRCTHTSTESKFFSRFKITYTFNLASNIAPNSLLLKSDFCKQRPQSLRKSTLCHARTLPVSDSRAVQAS